MLNYECKHDEHLAPLSRFEADNGFSSSDDSEMGIVATYDLDEYELVQLSTYLRVDSGSEYDDNRIEREADATRRPYYKTLPLYKAPLKIVIDRTQ
ncbi:unnamed protein product [Rotaria magnacalcarata]|uniref:Uncharacterized protein n=2 Tax=Rotaria magnacalcarata TaxID=392030 RepID=A0A8S2L6R6_9BILA|nr:unnamed protein product [Rotaria magnacalcarata]